MHMPSQLPFYLIPPHLQPTQPTSQVLPGLHWYRKTNLLLVSESLHLYLVLVLLLEESSRQTVLLQRQIVRWSRCTEPLVPLVTLSRSNWRQRHIFIYIYLHTVCVTPFVLSFLSSGPKVHPYCWSSVLLYSLFLFSTTKALFVSILTNT